MSPPGAVSPGAQQESNHAFREQVSASPEGETLAAAGSLGDMLRQLVDPRHLVRSAQLAVRRRCRRTPDFLVVPRLQFAPSRKGGCKRAFLCRHWCLSCDVAHGRLWWTRLQVL